MRLDPSSIINQANAFYESCVLFAAIDAGIFTVLAHLGGADIDAVAGKIGADQKAMRLLLDACVATGLIVKDGDLYRNSAEADAFLVKGKPADLSGAICYNRDVYPAWGRLLELVRSGKPVEVPELHLGEDEARTRTFVMSMHYRAMAIGQAVMPHVDLAGRRTLLDIGGGPAAYSILACRKSEAIKCRVLDLPAVVRIAAELVEKSGLKDRIELIPADYHKADFPAGNDVVNIFGVLHQESPDLIGKILKKAYNSMEQGGVINILDMMTDASRTSPKFSALFAVNMALTTENGWVFSDEDMRGWLADAGFIDIKLVKLPPPMPHWLMTAVKSK